MKQQFMNKCALDAGGVAAKLGYMKFENFAEDDRQFVIANVRCSKDHPVLLILKNHSSHLTEGCRFMKKLWSSFDDSST